MKRPLLSVFIVASFMVAIAHCFPDVSRREEAVEDNRGPNKGNRHPVLVLPDETGYAFFRPIWGISDFLTSGFGGSDESPESDIPFETNLNPLGDSFFTNFFKSLWNTPNRFDLQPSGIPSDSTELENGGEIPEAGNTTSTTKIINGHVVTINETTYRSGDSNFNFVARVRTIDVAPVNKTSSDNGEVEIDLTGSEEVDTSPTRVDGTPSKNAGNETTTEEPRSVETVEDSAGNEIPHKNQEDNFDA